MSDEKIYSPSLHPGVLKQVEKDLSIGSPGKAVLNSGTTVLTELHRQYGAMVEAERSFVGMDRTPLAKAAEASFGKAAKLVDAQRAAMLKQKAHLENEVGIKLRAPSSDQKFADPARSYIRGLQPSDRVPFMMRIINSGDIATVSAVLEGPAYLSGLDDEQRALVKSTASVRFAKDEATQLKAVEATIKKVEAAAAVFLKKYADLVEASKDPRRDRAAEKLSALTGAA